MKSNKPQSSIKAEQRKVLPYSIEVIGDKAALERWKAGRLLQEDVDALRRQATRDRAVVAYSQGAGDHLDPATRERIFANRVVACLPEPPKPWYVRAKDAVIQAISNIWRNANFGA